MRSFLLRGLAVPVCVWLAGSSAVRAQDLPTPLTVIGLDRDTHEAVEVPADIRAKAVTIYEMHEEAFSTPPKITVTTNGEYTLFYVKRAEVNNTAAAAGNHLPFKSATSKILSTSESAVLSPLRTYRESDICTNGIGEAVRQQGNLVKWCDANGHSVQLFADRMGEWNTDLLISHEFIHLRQYEKIPGTKNDGAPSWVVEGQANGIGFGMFEREPGPGRRAIALETKDAKNSNFSFFLGLRYFDQPLDVDGWSERYPKDHPEYPVARTPEDPNHITMAGYMTGSFWRQVMRGRPRGFNAYQQMLDREGPSDPTSSVEWLQWTDAGLKAARYRDVPIWRGGLRQVFSEMVTEYADFPDIVARDRTGKLAPDTFDALIWSKGCTKVNLTASPAATVPIEILPYSARCLRVRMPTYGPQEINFVAKTSSWQFVKTLPVPFTVAAIGDDSCEELELGTRGQLVQHPVLVRPKDKGYCIINWQAGYAPLNEHDPNGLQGWQTITLIYAPTLPTGDRTAKTFNLSIVQPVASVQATGSYAVSDNGGPPQRKPLPKSRGKVEVQSNALNIVPVEATDEVCDADDAANFLCGDTVSFSVLTGDMADTGADVGNAILGSANLRYLPGTFTRDGLQSLGDIYAMLDLPTFTTGLMPLRASGKTDGAKYIISTRRLAEGATGTFPATIQVETFDSAGTGQEDLNSLAPKRTRTGQDGCVTVMSLQTTGSLTITVNEGGLLVGSFSANLYEQNSAEDPEATCRNPRVRAGQASGSFASPGLFYIGPDGPNELDFSRTLTQQHYDADMTAQVLTPLHERSDLLPDDELTPQTRAELAAYSSSGAGSGGDVPPDTGTCEGTPISAEDRSGFLAAIAKGMGNEDPATAQQMVASMSGFGTGLLAPYICRWISQGRPDTYTMEEE
ncbi:hypothetical protein [Arenimonas sp. MALMAid1274]|uniref:hypothetical protein n=1 Tax=Arenimonas sp. MALMAid1274 TaxID=3411630 RepID=UPI003BA3DA14